MNPFLIPAVVDLNFLRLFIRQATRVSWSMLGNSTGSALGRQTVVCGVLDFQYIPRYASDLHPCIHRFAKPMNPQRKFQTGSYSSGCVIGKRITLPTVSAASALSAVFSSGQAQSLLGNSAGSALGRQPAVCGVLDFQHIPKYALDLHPCIHRFAKPMHPHRTFQTGS